MKATIWFAADPSVGIFSYSFCAEIPPFEEEYREEIRSLIKRLYDDLDAEFTCQVFFSDEKL